MALTDTIETWLHEVTNDPENGPCKNVALVHMAGTVQEPVYTKQIPEKFNADDLTNWADLLTRKAEQYAEGLPGTQTFCLMSFHGEGKRPGVRKSFPVKGYVEQDGLMTENPTGKGVLQQMMRLCDSLVSKAITAQQVALDSMTKRLEIETRIAMAQRTENVQLFDFSKDLVLKLSDRTQEHALKQIDAKLTADLKREAIKNAPLLLEMATGRDILPANKGDSLLIERMIDEIASKGPEQLMTMSIKDLPAPLLAALADRFQKGLAARQKEQTVRQSVDDSDGPIDGGLQ